MSLTDYEVIDRDFSGSVCIAADTENNPVVVAVFDGEKRVSEWVAALQKEDLYWFAEGYSEACENYREPYQKPASQ